MCRKPPNKHRVHAILLGLVLGVAGAVQARPSVAAASAAGARLPLVFEANRGQSAPEVKFLTRSSRRALFLTASEAVLVLGSDPGGRRPGAPAGRPAAPPGVLRIRFAGARPQAEVAGLDEQGARSHHYVGGDPRGWLRDVPLYGRVLYRDIYPGIDLVFYGAGNDLEFDFVVAPGADPRAVRLAFTGAGGLSLTGGGDLELAAGPGRVALRKPSVYQVAGGERRPVEARYVRRGRGQVGVEVGGYDPARTLVIDPVLSYSTYLGGRATDRAAGVAADGAGNAYLTGWTMSADFPTRTAGQPAKAGPVDAFVAKIDSSGVLEYSTYLGGTGTDYGYGIAVEPSGAVWVVGHTGSPNFPSRNPIQGWGGGGDAFVTRLDATGALGYSTHLGGSTFDAAYGIAVDPGGAAYVTGETSSADFPTRNAIMPFQGGLDAFVLRIGAAGGLDYSTFLGGSGIDSGWSIARDDTGSAYVTGSTDSTDFRVVNPIQGSFVGGFLDAFVTKLDPVGGGPIYSTYLGGDAEDYGYGIAADPGGNAVITGQTSSGNLFPVLNAFQPALAGGNDAFVTRLDAAGALLFSTYLGGALTLLSSPDDIGYGIALDRAGNASITGSTLSIDFPAVGALQARPGGRGDAFLARIDGAGTLLFSSYLGGSEEDTGLGVATGMLGDTYVTGHTTSLDFPLLRPYQATGYGPASGGDGFALRVCWDSPTGSVGGALKAVKRLDDVDLDWSAGPLSPRDYNLHRETTGMSPPAGAPVPLSSVEAHTDRSVVATPPSLYYQVFGRDCAGLSIFR